MQQVQQACIGTAGQAICAATDDVYVLVQAQVTSAWFRDRIAAGQCETDLKVDRAFASDSGHNTVDQVPRRIHFGQIQVIRLRRGAFHVVTHVFHIRGVGGTCRSTIDKIA